MLDMLLHDLTVHLPPTLRLQRVVSTLKTHFGGDAVALLALEGTHEQKVLRPVAAVGLSRDVLGRRFVIAEQPRLAAILATREVVAFDRDSGLHDPYDGLVAGRPGQPLPVHDCMGVRLQLEGRPWGLLTLDGLVPGRFDEAVRTGLRRAAVLIEAAVRMTRLERECHALRQARWRSEPGADADDGLLDDADDLEIVADSDAMRALLHESRIVAASDLPVLLLGETGVGKELLARRLHRLSSRHGKPLVQVNCAALPETLAESELFGHVRGAFSGATSARAGRIEAAQHGTLFLDEVGELPLPLQAKLLRTLQNGEIQRLGADRPRQVDVRVVAATNRDLKAAVRDGLFRADLYHRLSVYPLPIPPLRERPQDILPLAGRFLEVNRARLGLRSLRLDSRCEQQLTAYAWPGNVRELEHVLGRAALRAASRRRDPLEIVTIGPDVLGLQADMPVAVAAPGPEGLPALALGDAGPPRPLRDTVDEVQRRCIVQALQRQAGNWSAAARELELDPSNLHKLARRLGVAGTGRRR